MGTHAVMAVKQSKLVHGKTEGTVTIWFKPRKGKKIKSLCINQKELRKQD